MYIPYKPCADCTKRECRKCEYPALKINYRRALKRIIELSPTPITLLRTTVGTEIVEYEVRCFERTLYVVFDKPVDEEEVLRNMETAYCTWHDEIDTMPCEEYIVLSLEDLGYGILRWESL